MSAPAYLPPNYPALPIDYRDLWDYQINVEQHVIEEPIENICWYICRVIVAIIIAYLTCGYFPKSRPVDRLCNRHVTHEITETFTCKDRTRTSAEEVRLLFAYLYAPYSPLEMGPEIAVDTGVAYAVVQDAGRFAISAKRSVIDWNDSFRLETSYMKGDSVTPLSTHTREVNPPSLTARRFRNMQDRSGHEHDFHFHSGSTFILAHYDSFLGRNIFGFTIAQMEKTLVWLGLNIRDVSQVCYRLQEILHSGRIDFESTGNWIVTLNEAADGTKSLRFVLRWPPGRPLDPDHIVRQSQLLHERLLEKRANAYYHNFFRHLDMQVFSDASEGLLGYTIRLAPPTV